MFAVLLVKIRTLPKLKPFLRVVSLSLFFFFFAVDDFKVFIEFVTPLLLFFMF